MGGPFITSLFIVLTICNLARIFSIIGALICGHFIYVIVMTNNGKVNYCSIVLLRAWNVNTTNILTPQKAHNNDIIGAHGNYVGSLYT